MQCLRIKLSIVFTLASLIGLSMAFSQQEAGRSPIACKDLLSSSSKLATHQENLLRDLIEDRTQLPEDTVRDLIASSKADPDQLIPLDNPAQKRVIGKWVLYHDLLLPEGWWRRHFEKQATREIFDSEMALIWDERKQLFEERSALETLIERLGKVTLYRGTQRRAGRLLSILKAIREQKEPSPERLFGYIEAHGSLSSYTRYPQDDFKHPVLSQLIREPAQWNAIMADSQRREQLIKDMFFMNAGYFGIDEKTRPWFFSNSYEWAKEFALSLSARDDQFKSAILKFEIDLTKILPDYIGVENQAAQEKYASTYPRKAFFEVAYGQQRLGELLDAFIDEGY